MKFGIISDLHMEFQPWLHEPDPDLFYLNAGDTHPQWLTRDYFHSLFKGKVFSVKGNHDYYGGSFKDAAMDFPESIFVEKPEGGMLKIAGAPLWTYITPERWWDFRDYMMDYRNIKGMNYDLYLNAHKTQHDYLFGVGTYADREARPLPDIVLLDLKMPGVDGFEVLRRVKAAPPLRRIPVIVLTSSKEEGDRATAYDAGANSYLLKPVSFSGFLDVVRKVETYWIELNVPPPPPS